MEDIIQRLGRRERGLLGTWVKLQTLETLEMLAHAGFDFVVVDMEHAPHSLESMYRLVFAAQTLGMSALVRLPDHGGEDIQRILDAGADGILVPRMTDPVEAAHLASKMVFSPKGLRGLGTTSRAGRWGQVPMQEYVRRGNEGCLRMLQLEDWQVLESAADYARLEHVNGLFVGLGDLYLSSGRPSHDPAVQALVERVLAVAKAEGVHAGIAASGAEEGRRYLDLGYSLVMVSNDASLFGRAAEGLVSQVLAP